MRGNAGQIQQRSHDGVSWSAWTSLTGTIHSSPAAVAPGSSRIDLWARGSDNRVRHNVWKSGVGWSGWNSTWFAGPRP
jgi:hypothetical protein